LDRPAALTHVDQSGVALASSTYSFLNSQPGRADYANPGPFVLAASAAVGEGQVSLLGDPSIITNSAQLVPADHAWLASLLGGSQPYLGAESISLSNLGLSRAAILGLLAPVGTPWGLFFSACVLAGSVLLTDLRRRPTELALG
jgi:hypothetical protein